MRSRGRYPLLLGRIFVGRAEWRRRVSVFCVLCFGAVDGLDMWIWLILRFARLRVVESLESGSDVGEHGEVDFACCVVPVEIEAEVPTDESMPL